MEVLGHEVVLDSKLEDSLIELRQSQNYDIVSTTTGDHARMQVSALNAHRTVRHLKESADAYRKKALAHLKLSPGASSYELYIPEFSQHANAQAIATQNMLEGMFYLPTHTVLNLLNEDAAGNFRFINDEGDPFWPEKGDEAAAIRAVSVFTRLSVPRQRIVSVVLQTMNPPASTSFLEVMMHIMAHHHSGLIWLLGLPMRTNQEVWTRLMEGTWDEAFDADHVVHSVFLLHGLQIVGTYKEPTATTHGSSSFSHGDVGNTRSTVLAMAYIRGRGGEEGIPPPLNDDRSRVDKRQPNDSSIRGGAGFARSLVDTRDLVMRIAFGASGVSLTNVHDGNQEARPSRDPDDERRMNRKSARKRRERKRKRDGGEKRRKKEEWNFCYSKNIRMENSQYLSKGGGRRKGGRRGGSFLSESSASSVSPRDHSASLDTRSSGSNGATGNHALSSSNLGPRACMTSTYRPVRHPPLVFNACSTDTRSVLVFNDPQEGLETMGGEWGAWISVPHVWEVDLVPLAVKSPWRWMVPTDTTISSSTFPTETLSNWSNGYTNVWLDHEESSDTAVFHENLKKSYEVGRRSFLLNMVQDLSNTVKFREERGMEHTMLRVGEAMLESKQLNAYHLNPQSANYRTHPPGTPPVEHAYQVDIPIPRWMSGRWKPMRDATSGSLWSACVRD
jgi:hypothetical protein